MILIFSRPDDGHLSLVASRLQALGAEYLCFDTGFFPSQAELSLFYEPRGLVRRVLRWGGRELDLSKVTAVWLSRVRKPEPAPDVVSEEQRRLITAAGRRALWHLCETLDCLWVPAKPRVDELGANKIEQLALAARLGFRVPRTLITNSPEEFLEFYAECGGRLVTKTLMRYTTRGGEDVAAHTYPVQRRDLARYRAVRHEALIIQEYVPKRVELRITVVGPRVFAAEINSQESFRTRHDWRHYDDDHVVFAVHTLPASIEALCLRLVRAMGLRFGAIDMIVTPEGEYVFLEINPNGAWGWIEALAGSIADAIAELLLQGAAAVREEEPHVLTV